VLCLIVVAIGFVCSKGIFGYSELRVQRTTEGNLHYLALGCGLALGRSFVKPSLVLLAVLFAVWGVCRGFRESNHNMPTLVFNLIWLGFYLLVAQTLFGMFGSWSIRSRVLAHLGRLCYGLYLIHVFVSVRVLSLCGQTAFVGPVLYFGGSWALAWLSYRFFEVPVQNLRTLLERRQLAGRVFLAVCAIVFVCSLLVSVRQLGDSP
jgi:peptidoglycan/LPS O-acetylase OafA/YrhL